MDGASPRPPTRRRLQGRQQARLRGRFIQGIRSLGPLGSNFSIPYMRAPRQPTIEGSSSVPSRESTRSTWNASGGLSGLPLLGDRQRFARGGAAVAEPPRSCKRVRGAARWSPWPTRAKRRRQTAAREDLSARSHGVIGSAGSGLATPVLERLASPRWVRRRVVARAHVEVGLLAMRVCPQQAGGIGRPRPRWLEIAREAGGGGRSTWNIHGDARPKAGDVPRGHAVGSRISDQRKTLETAAGPRIPA
jgi:hypothetical protein